MNARTRRALLAGVIIAACGAFVGAQAAKPASKAKRMRVFFIEPKNNATVTSPVHMKFGAEGIGTRPGVAHCHVGIDQDCLPAGKNIVKGTPSWVHFGDGKDVFDSQLTPGKHKLSLQLGDDLHNTLPGTCQTITVNVKQ
ncbi:MAG: rod shape-determining protein RodA [Acidobacteria bacterium]|nr:MAG: rod shape-determining protein RodA [Acidobacteriota bacterium]